MRQRIYDAAVRMLGGREHSAFELHAKLKRRFPPEQIEIVLSELQEQGLQDDARFAEVLIRSRINRGYGPHYIQQELRAKQVSFTETDDWLQADWLDLADNLMSRKFDYQECEENQKAWQKALRFFQRRGFPGNVAYEVLPPMPKQ